jgi:hypothetical protein
MCWRAWIHCKAGDSRRSLSDISQLSSLTCRRKHRSPSAFNDGCGFRLCESAPDLMNPTGSGTWVRWKYRK